MAADENVDRALVTHFERTWEIQSGPLAQLPARSQREWTLLVQGVNLHDDAADALLRTFDYFLPDARLDDLMISYATDGGGVGRISTSYDVFLLQAHGQRRWRFGAQKDLSLVDGVPLKILRNFEPQQEFVLNPGELDLPPHIAHDGVAEGECMTYSVGFRAPAYQELAEAFLQFMADSVDLPGRYADPELEPCSIRPKSAAPCWPRSRTKSNKVRFTEDDIADRQLSVRTEGAHRLHAAAVNIAAGALCAKRCQTRRGTVAQDANALSRQARFYQR